MHICPCLEFPPAKSHFVIRWPIPVGWAAKRNNRPTPMKRQPSQLHPPSPRFPWADHPPTFLATIQPAAQYPWPRTTVKALQSSKTLIPLQSLCGFFVGGFTFRARSFQYHITFKLLCLVSVQKVPIRISPVQ
ncbi:hypothetical protein TWF679_006693 [Orbilia oligospora]|uniref:Uncharacterized protein n=1 Tax=Orbilia oligospora TaxID=2813651 RepID=A0A8H8V8V3_ORBOL|nr:hypothetical protein TWF679_006693 [Orbilia oligospora]